MKWSDRETPGQQHSAGGRLCSPNVSFALQRHKKQNLDGGGLHHPLSRLLGRWPMTSCRLTGHLLKTESLKGEVS